MTTKIKKVKNHPMRKWRSHTSVDPKLVYELALKHTTQEEIAASIGIDPKTLAAHFREELDRGFADGNIAVRTAQLDLALSGNPQLLIHLGKYWLGQKESLIVQEVHRGAVEELLECLKRDCAQAGA
jgi:hypothetical protein